MSLLVKTMSYEGKAIRARDDEKVNLTDMWRAAGSDPNKRPAEWLRRDSTVEFSAHLEDMGLAHTLTDREKGDPRSGSGGSTWAHWHLALAYARYLDHAFHVWCNEVIRREMQGGSPLARRHEKPEDLQRVGESPGCSLRLRRAVTRVHQSRGYSIQRIHGFIRKTRHVSSPFFLPCAALDRLVEDLEHLEAMTFDLGSARRKALPARSTSQMEMFDRKKAN